MRNFKKILALLLALTMVLGLGVAAFADDPVTPAEGGTPAGGEAPAGVTHTITIKNTDQNVSHTYKAYQVFAGNLDQDGQGTKLSNIVWGEGVDGAAILTALKASGVDASLTNTTGSPITVAAAVGTEGEEGYVEAKVIAVGESLFKYCENAADVAEVISDFAATGKFNADGTVNAADGGVNLPSGAIDAFANIVGTNTKGTGTEFTENDKTYTATVSGDGYYIIKDETAETGLVDDDTTASDTRSKYLLAVVKDTEIVAKDTGLTPDKKINNGTSNVAADSAAIGDTVNFVVTVKVPNTKKYIDHFIFDMQDTLPAGITFTGITSVEVGSKTLADASLTTPNHTATGYDGANGFYTLKLGDTPAVPTITEGKYPWQADGYDAVSEAGGQKIKLIFNEFKQFVEKNDLIGETVTVKYTGVVNDDAEYKATENENEVKFEYSNDPNHDYDGDEPGPDDVTGKTPESKTRTYTTSLKILKVGDDGKTALPGAIFELTGTALNRTVLTGDKYELTTYTAKGDEVVDTTKTYWKLLDGSYTDTDPASLTNTSKYASTTDKYYKVSYTFDEVSEQQTDITVVTDSNGIAEFVGLNEGSDYTLEEIAAPEGYNKIEGKSNITIKWADPENKDYDTTPPTGFTADEWAIAKTQGGYYLSEAETSEHVFGITWNDTDKQFEITIQNKSGTQLPSTGGIGTTIFYIVGGLLAVGAGVVLVAKKRMGKVED